MQIENYPDNSGNKNVFYINTDGKLPANIEQIAFSIDEISNGRLKGSFMMISPIIDYIEGTKFSAVKK